MWDAGSDSDENPFEDPSEFEEGIAVDTEDDEPMEAPDELQPAEPEKDMDVHDLGPVQKFKNGQQQLCSSCGVTRVIPKFRGHPPFYILPNGVVSRAVPQCPPIRLTVH